MSERADILLAARDHLTGLLEVADERSAPALSRELRAVLAELEELSPPAVKGGTALDELTARRQGNASPSGRSARRSV